MNKAINILFNLIIILSLTFLTESCSNKEQEENICGLSKSETTLRKYASFHNTGLDYIKGEIYKYKGNCTQIDLISAVDNYVYSIYDRNKANEIIQQITPIEKDFFNGNVPTLYQTRCNITTDKPDDIAMNAITECLDKITNHLKSFKDDEILDNISLLNELQKIIVDTYNIYVKENNSDEEIQKLSQTLGVLYGSIEYWIKSDNVEYWSNINITDNKYEDTKYNITRESNKNNNNNKKDDNKNGNNKDKDKNKENNKEVKKVSLTEFLTGVAAADAIGACMGAAVASGPAAVAASAAAAIVYEY